MDYRLWQQTMYCHFGQKWSLLHHGPMWNVTYSAQSDESRPSDVKQQSTMNVCMYVIKILSVKFCILHRLLLTYLLFLSDPYVEAFLPVQ